MSSSSKSSGDDDGGSVLPEVITNNLGTLSDFLRNPGKFIRGFIFGSLLAGIGDTVAPLFDVAQLLMLGSDPSTFGADGEIWGLADVPVVVGSAIGSTTAAVISLGFETYAAVIGALIPAAGTPLVAPLAAVALVATAVLIFRVALPAIQALLEAIPVVGGPLATILGELRS